MKQTFGLAVLVFATVDGRPIAPERIHQKPRYTIFSTPHLPRKSVLPLPAEVQTKDPPAGYNETYGYPDGSGALIIETPFGTKYEFSP